ncbi:MAG: sensor histidine kinase, partial [Maribacter sp.]
MKFLKTHIKLGLLPFFLVFLSLSTFLQGQTDSTKTDSITLNFDQARILKNQNKLDQALIALKNAEDLAERRDDKKLLIDSYQKQAILFLELDKQDGAEIFWDRSKALLKDIEYPYGKAIFKYIEAKMLYRRDNKFQALLMLEEAKQLNNDRNFFNNILLLEGIIYVDLEKYEVASKNFNSLIVNTDVYEKEFLATKAHLGMSLLNFKTENYEESVSNGESALRIALENNFDKEVKEANELLTQVYEKIERFDLSSNNYKNLLVLRDSIFNAEKIRTEAKTANKIQFDFMSDQIAKQDKEIEDLTDATNRADIIVILVSAFLIIISLLAVSLYRNNQIKLKTNDLLQTKNGELQTARDAAVSAMETKTNFLSTVSHELRTPLYAVTGLTHLLLEENPSKNQKEHLKALKFSGDYLLNFINDILQINKIDADKLEPLNIDFNLKRTLKEVIDSLQQSAKSNRTKIILEYDEDIPGHLMSDPIKLSQVFMNLVGNALKFTKDGEVKVIAKLMKKDDEDVTLYFEVADTGIGISKEKQDSIFEGFEQGSIQINREYGGTGLGLT